MLATGSRDPELPCPLRGLGGWESDSERPAQNHIVRRAILWEQYEAANLAFSEMIARVDPMNILPVDRALRIYGVLADRCETKGSREQLSRYLMKLYIAGERDQHRLTVHGMSYLRDLDRRIDSSN
ncbi:hypothetical protein BraRD5C2_74930 [Bradyrhizobium sp. RD5-C2]|nr:hypothetical protein BraRD5C2_74930 [Bradyrhizobium sp. RD5-C2]